MYKFVIDTDSEKLSSVNVYADKDKTKRIAAPLDAVGRFAQTVEVAFIGSRKPSASDSLQLVVSWDGTIDSILQSSDEAPQRAYIAHAGTPLEGEADTWTFPVRFESAALEAALAKRTKITLRGAIVVENEAAGTHVEYHFSVGAAASIFAGAIADPQTAPIEFARILRMSWADYQALDAIDPDVIYIVADAPGTDELIKDAIKNAGFATLENIKSGVQTQSVMGYNGAQGKPTGNALYLDGENLSATSGGHAIDFPTKPGTVALLSDLGGGSESGSIEENKTLNNPVLINGKVGAAMETEGFSLDDNANIRGYLGTLRALGIVSDECNPLRITAYSRTGGSSGERYLRILRKNELGEWHVAYESTNKIDMSGFSEGAAATWEMVNMDGQAYIPSDEEIVIAGTSSISKGATETDQLGVRITRALRGALPPGADLVEANKQSYAPAFRISYEALDPIASQRDIRTFEGLGEVSERIAALEAKIAVLEAALSVATLSFPTGMSDYEVPYLTQHDTLVTVGTLPTAGGSYVIHVLGVNRETLNATCEADWVSNVQTQASVFWDENTNKGCILFDVAQNYDATPRSTTITLTSSALNEVYTIQITQAGA